MVFALKVLENRPMDEICKELALTTANGGVRMHRARLGLRKCLSCTGSEEKPDVSKQEEFCYLAN
jgi:RNA polymerase sigma-70 factor (ECF subfamily)